MNIQWLWFTLLITVMPVRGTDDFTITHATTAIHDDECYLNVQVKYAFSDVVLEALDNGVPLNLHMRIQVRHEFAWMWENSLVDKIVVSSIRYQPLTEIYTVTHLPSEPKQSFVTRTAAISALGEIEDLPLLKYHWLQLDKRYFVYIKVFIDLESLPLPLRPLAHLTQSWNLESGWTKWPLIP